MTFLNGWYRCGQEVLANAVVPPPAKTAPEIPPPANGRKRQTVIEVECWPSTAAEIERGPQQAPPREVIPYWKNVIRPTVDKRTIQSFRQWPDE